MAQTGKHLPTMQETWVRSLSQEDPLEKEIATHTSTLAWKKSHRQRILLCYSPWGCKESGTTEQLHFTSLQSHGEFHGQRSLVGSSGVARSPRGHKESDTTEQLVYIKSHVCKIYPHDLSTFQGSHLPSSLLLFSCSVVSGSL